MSTPYPPQPRRLMRDPSKKLIGGVCSGVAKYLNMDVNLVRILTVIISLFTGIPIVLYLIALFVLPEERDDPQPPHVTGPPAGAYGAGFAGQPGQQPYGAPAQPPANDVWGAAGAPWEQPQTAAPAEAAAPAPARPTWQQPPAWQSSQETTAEVPDPEPVPETEAPQAPTEEASTWESAPADPSSAQESDQSDQADKKD